MTTITLAHAGTTITLSDRLHWTDEFDWHPVEQASSYSTTGAPMPMHAAMPGLSAELFQRWLAAFYASNTRQPNQAMAAQANAMAERIAQSLWMGYQMRNGGDAMPAPLRTERPASHG